MSLKDRKTSGLPKSNRRSADVRRAYRSRSRVEQETNRLVLIASGVIALVIVLILGGAILIDVVIKPAQSVLTVGNSTVSSADFQKRVSYQRWRDGNLISQYYNSQFGQQLLSDTSGAIGQLYSAMTSPILYGNRVLDQMIDEALIAQYAKDKGITVDAATIDKRSGELFNYIPNPTTATPTVTPSVTPTPLITATVSPTPTITPTVTPLPPGSPTPTLTPAPTLTFTPFPTGLPTVTPGPTEQKENFDQRQTDYFTSAAKLTGLSVADLRQQFHDEVYRDELRQKVLVAIGGELAPMQEQNLARHILVATEDQAKDVIAAINAGESFAALAKAVSTDTGSGANGGELGWAYRGKYVKEFEDFVWAAKPGELSAPIKSQFGYHVIQLEARETRLLSESDQQAAQQKRFSDWLTAQKDAVKPVKADFWTDRVPSTPSLTDFGVPTNLSAGGGLGGLGNLGQ
jgi:parvulin-like peptidyl-prolyl isomerase